MNAEEFHAAFASRTAAYLGDRVEIDDRPVLVRVGDDAHTEAGHALVYALTNQLARAHSQLAFAGDLDRPLLCQGMFGESSLADATIGLATEINPDIAIFSVQTVDPLATLVIGDAGPADIKVGCSGWCALFGGEATVADDDYSIWGACLAACIAATYCFHRMLGREGSPAASYSLFEYGATSRAQGPSARAIDVGRVLQAGAGAVGSALDFWLVLIGAGGEWTVVDGDNVDASNLNRQLTFIASDCGYPSGKFSNKAIAVGERLGIAEPSPTWWGQDPAVRDRDYDLVLALANEHGVRAQLQQPQPPLLLHATTSNNWQAQLHRHIPHRGDCINCRLPEDAPKLTCAVGDIGERKEVDASLPFLSATAGLLLAAELLKLGLPGYPTDEANFVSLYLGAAAPAPPQLLRRRGCREECEGWLDLGLIREIHSENPFLRVLPG